MVLQQHAKNNLTNPFSHPLNHQKSENLKKRIIRSERGEELRQGALRAGKFGPSREKAEADSRHLRSPADCPGFQISHVRSELSEMLSLVLLTTDKRDSDNGTDLPSNMSLDDDDANDARTEILACRVNENLR